MTNCTIALISHASNVQNSPSQTSAILELRTSRCSSWFWKRQRNQRSNCQHPLDHWKSKRVPKKTSIIALLTMQKALTVWVTINCGKFYKRLEYQNTWPASWETCVQVRKQKLELDMEQQTHSKQEKEYVKAVYCHPAYLSYMQSTSWETLDWKKQKLESRLPGEISITSDMQMTPPLWQKVKRN